MDYFKIKDNNYKLSRFTIGTVQPGTTYGIDTLGKPSDGLDASLKTLGARSRVSEFCEGHF